MRQENPPGLLCLPEQHRKKPQVLCQFHYLLLNGSHIQSFYCWIFSCQNIDNRIAPNNKKMNNIIRKQRTSFSQLRYIIGFLAYIESSIVFKIQTPAICSVCFIRHMIRNYIAKIPDNLKLPNNLRCRFFFVNGNIKGYTLFAISYFIHIVTIAQAFDRCPFFKYIL